MDTVGAAALSALRDGKLSRMRSLKLEVRNDPPGGSAAVTDALLALPALTDLMFTGPQFPGLGAFSELVPALSRSLRSLTVKMMGTHALNVLRDCHFDRLTSLDLEVEREVSMELVASTLSALPALTNLSVESDQLVAEGSAIPIINVPSLTSILSLMYCDCKFIAKKLIRGCFDGEPCPELKSIMESSPLLQQLQWGRSCIWPLLPVPHEQITRLLTTPEVCWPRLVSLQLFTGLVSNLIPHVAACCPHLREFTCGVVVPDKRAPANVARALQLLPEVVEVFVFASDPYQPNDDGQRSPVPKLRGTLKDIIRLPHLRVLRLAVYNALMLRRLEYPETTSVKLIPAPAP